MCPRERTDMRSLREILRLSFELNLTANEIHRTIGVSRDVVQKRIKAAKEANIDWQTATEMDDHTLAKCLFPEKEEVPSKFIEPDWDWVNRELKKRGVNRQLLWMEYVGKSSEHKYSYSQFNRLFKSWLKRHDLSMRQEHKAGDKLFVDYAGQTVPVVVDCETGDVRTAQIFVAVLGASNYCYVEASWSQDLPSWIGAHVRALEHLKGVPQCLVPDNLRSGVTEAERFDPMVNRTYQRLAEHYGCSIRPARPVHPKDKAKVEKGVQYAETWILARMRNYTFFSLRQLNDTIQELLIDLNNEPFQKIEGSRLSLYQELDLPAMETLPATPFEMEEWLIGIKVEKDYHVTVDGHHYSVPYHLRGERVDVRFTDAIVEIFHDNRREASHLRNKIQNGISTQDVHRAPQHALYAGMSADGLLDRARGIGTFTVEVVSSIINAHPYPQLALDKCFGILYSLRAKYGDARLESAAEYAMRMGSPTYRMMKAALKAGDTLPKQIMISTFDNHENLRGPEEFKDKETHNANKPND